MPSSQVPVTPVAITNLPSLFGRRLPDAMPITPLIGACPCTPIPPAGCVAGGSDIPRMAVPPSVLWDASNAAVPSEVPVRTTDNAATAGGGKLPAGVAAVVTRVVTVAVFG
jgi:hypothetical protein